MREHDAYVIVNRESGKPLTGQRAVGSQLIDFTLTFCSATEAAFYMVRWDIAPSSYYWKRVDE